MAENQEFREEKGILLKFKNGAVITSEAEMQVLQKWASVGLVKFGADFVNKKAEAILTKRGKWLLPVITDL